MTRKISILLMVMLCTIFAMAQSIKVSAPSQVGAGENFRIAFTVDNKDAQDFKAGEFPSEIEVLAGPYSSVQSSYQIINGKTSSSSSITYTFTLYAEKSGTYTIPEATAIVDGKEVKSSPVTISVVGTVDPNSSGSQRGRSNSIDGRRVKQSGSRITSDELFVTVSASKKRVREQEPILLTYKVYTLVELTQLNGKMPDLTGFHTQEIQLPQQKSFHIEEYNGKKYRCVTWSQYVMYPQMTGKLTIPSITFKGIVLMQNRNIDPFEAFFNGGAGYEEVKQDVVAPSVDIEVLPLPDKPADFSGGVGSFSIKASADNTSVKSGDPVTIRINISGVGNLKLIKQPEITVPKDFDKYDPKVTDKTKLTTRGIEGSMEYEYLVVPRNQGKYTIEPVELTYFDLSSNTYKTIKTDEINLTVAKGEGNDGNVIDYSSEIDSDIRPIKRGVAVLSITDKFFFGSSSYWLCLALPVVAFIFLLIIFRRRAINSADIVKAKGKKANKIATKRLKAASRLMSEGKQNEFYDEVMRALWGYVGDKLNIPVAQLSRENISEELSVKGIETDTIDKFIGALDECEFERYAPGDAAGNMDKTYTSAMVAITEIENSLKKVKNKKNKATNAVSILMFLLLMPLTLSATTKEEADTEYTKGNYQQAIIMYEDILQSGISPDVYYNLGNAYYRTGNVTRAILAYERALVMSPGDKDIRFNLQFVSNKTIDKIASRNEMFFITWWRQLINATSVDSWAKIAIVSIAVALIMLLVFLFTSRDVLRKTGFYGAVIFVVVFLFSNFFAYQQKKQFTEHSYAIVIDHSVDVKKTPAEDGDAVFIIHEGTKVDITDKDMKGWRAIQIADGREGWVKEEQIEEI